MMIFLPKVIMVNLDINDYEDIPILRRLAEADIGLYNLKPVLAVVYTKRFNWMGYFRRRKLIIDMLTNPAKHKYNMVQGLARQIYFTASHTNEIIKYDFDTDFFTNVDKLPEGE